MNSPIKAGNHIVKLDILMLMNAENCQEGQPLLTHSGAKRVFQSLLAAKATLSRPGGHWVCRQRYQATYIRVLDNPQGLVIESLNIGPHSCGTTSSKCSHFYSYGNA